MKLWHYIKHAPKVFFKQGTLPIYLVFFVTHRCNLRCRHCLLGETLPHPQKELTLEEITRIASNMGDLMFLLLTGGEPFLRKDLAEIVKIFYRETNVRNVGIPTNGTFQDNAVSCVKEILSACPEIDLGVDVSIDGQGECHDRIRGIPGTFEKAVATYKQLRELQDAYPNFNVNIETTISSFNEDGLAELYDFLTKELRANTIFTLLARGVTRDPAAKSFNIEKYACYAKSLEGGIKERDLTGYFNFPFCEFINAKRIVRHRLIAKTVKENRYQIPCYAGRLGVAISPYADVYACELLTDKPLGNLRDNNYDFRKIWFSRQANEARKWIRDTKCFCTYECFHTLNILFNPRMYPALVREWLVLKRSKYGRRK